MSLLSVNFGSLMLWCMCIYEINLFFICNVFICLHVDYAWLHLLRRDNALKWSHVSMFPYCVIDSRP
jgi:hypothetical protein